MTRTLFSISVANIAVLKITEAKIATKVKVIITELTAAMVIHPLRFKLFKASNRWRKNLLIIVSVLSFRFVTNHTTILDGNDTVAQGIYDLAIVGRHQNSRTLEIDALQEVHDFP